MTSTDPRESKLGPWTAAAMVVASMIGVGVFTTSGFALADLQSRELVLSAWVVGGVLALCGTACYGALARAMPQSGGEYHFLAKLIHPVAGFLAGWISLLAGFTAPTAAAALGFQAYLAPLLDLGDGLPWLASMAILLTGLQHGVGVRFGAGAQNLVVGLKLTGLLAFLGYGAWTLLTSSPAPSPEGVAAMTSAATTPASDAFPLAAFAVSLVWISFSFSGWNAAVYIAGELREPERHLHRSLLGGCILVTLLYLGLNAIFLYSAPLEVLAGQPDVAAIAAEHFGGPAWRDFTSLLIALALLTSISAMVQLGPRVYARMAEDGLFPQFFRPRDGQFRHAILLQCSLALVVVWSSRLSALLGYIGFTLSLSAAATVLAFLIRGKRAEFRIPGAPITPILFLLGTFGSAGFLVARAPEQALWGLLTVASGLPLYFWMRRRDPA